MDEGGGTSRSAESTTVILASEESTPLDETLNGSVNIRKTHPGLYRLVMGIALICIALGVNFLVGDDVLGILNFHPTFFVYDMPNWVWAVGFLAIGLGKIVFLNLYRSLRLTRLTMAFSFAYISVFGAGTMQPAFEGKGSLQLPILYVGLAGLLASMILEPYINPRTRRDL